MSSRRKRESHATSAAASSTDPLYTSTDPATGGREPRASAPTSTGFQYIRPSQQEQSPPMAVQQPLLPSIPSSFSHHRGGISIDSTSTRASFPSPLNISQLEEPQSPEGIRRWSTSGGDAAQRRVFRQRRKEPSCDACRERKVKCDATPSGNCSECIARGIRCQFTKDSNKRMSSIKQVQELQKQIGQVRRENERLKLMLTPADGMDLDTSPNPSPTAGYHTRRRSGRSQAYAQATRNIHRYARGIFKPPPSHRLRRSRSTITLDRNFLPEERRALELINSCQNTFIKDLPIVDWDPLRSYLRSLHGTSAATGMSRPQMALLFSVLALGSLQDSTEAVEEIGKDELIRKAVHELNLEMEELELDHCRAALMISIYYMEAGQSSTAWLWVSLTTSMAFDIGLHEEGPSTMADEDAEARRRIWWTIYLWERILSVELSQPLLISDEDLRVALPSSGLSAEQHRQSSVLTTTMPLMRLYGMLRRMLRRSDTSPATLITFESLLEPVATSYPMPPAQSRPTDNDTNFLYFTVLLSNARLILHRQRLSPSQQVEERLHALESCVAAAHGTSRCVEAGMIRLNQQLEPSSSSAIQESGLGWSRWIRSSASSIMCTHLWRCILALSFAQDFTPAIICARACRAIGQLRQINVKCGRHLIFFLERILRTPGFGEVRKQTLVEDLEMLAHVTGDMQGDSRRAWAWSESESSAQVSQLGVDPALEPSHTISPAESIADPDVWARVEELLEQLQGERTLQRPLPEFDPGQEPQAGPPAPKTRRRNSNSRKRMSIANII